MGIFKEVNKNSKSKKAKNKRPVSPMPSPVEVAPDAVPMPEAWGGPKSLEELFQPKPLKQTPPQQSPKQTAKPAAQQKRKKEEVQAEARELLKRVGLEDKANSYPRQLSGGQKQRLSIARAIAKHPDVYIFDDSFSALDYKTDTVLRSALKEKTTDSVVLIVAQRISTILHAEQIIVLDDGKIVGKGTHEELLKTCDAYYQIAASQLSESELKEAMKEED